MQGHFLINWFKNPDYQSGVEYYLKHGDNQALKNLFQKGPTDFSKRKLKEVLKTMLPAETEVENKPIDARKFREIPQWFTDLEQERIMWLKERDSLRGALLHFTSDEERKKAAFRILDLGDLIYESGLKLKEFRETGKVPVEKAIQPSEYEWLQYHDIALMRYYFNSLKVRISRAKKDPEKHQALQKELEAIEQEINKREHGTVQK